MLYKEWLWGILVFMKVIGLLFLKYLKYKIYRSVLVLKCIFVWIKVLIVKKKKDINIDILFI